MFVIWVLFNRGQQVIIAGKLHSNLTQTSISIHQMDLKRLLVDLNKFLLEGPWDISA